MATKSNIPNPITVLKRTYQFRAHTQNTLDIFAHNIAIKR